MCVQDDAYAGEDVHAGGVLALFNAGEVGSINACEQGQIACFHLFGLTKFLDALTNANAFGLSVTGVQAH